MFHRSQSSCEIRNFTEFLSKCLGKRVIEYQLNHLTKPGDNYGSVMLSVEVKVAEIDKVCIHSKYSVDKDMFIFIPLTMWIIVFAVRCVAFSCKNADYQPISCEYISTRCHFHQGSSLLFRCNSCNRTLRKNVQRSRNWTHWCVYTMSRLQILVEYRLLS